MSSKVVKSTSKGQVTLPKKWRDQFATHDFLMKIQGNMIIIRPVNIQVLEIEEDIIFDADRDNGGQGVTPDEMIRLLKEVQNG